MKNKTLSIATLLLTGALLFAGCGQTGNTTASSGGKLPQTGQLWWPVPVLAGAGLVLVVVGFRLHSKK